MQVMKPQEAELVGEISKVNNHLPSRRCFHETLRVVGDSPRLSQNYFSNQPNEAETNNISSKDDKWI